VMIQEWTHYRIKSALDCSPRLYLRYLRWKHRRTSFVKRIISAESDICIEGHNRSANSFGVKAFRLANDSNAKQHIIATHVHASAQVKQAVSLGVPTIVLIRKPEPTVMSQKSLAIQLKQIDRPDQYPIEIFLKMYTDFYRRLLPVKDRVLVVAFEEMTTDFAKVITRLNEKFGTSYRGVKYSKDQEAEIFQSSRVHLSPSPERQEIKKCLSQEMAALQKSAELRSAQTIYQQFLKL
jgi:hypothetical protein